MTGSGDVVGLWRRLEVVQAARDRASTVALVTSVATALLGAFDLGCSVAGDRTDWAWAIVMLGIVVTSIVCGALIDRQREVDAVVEALDTAIERGPR